MARPVARMLVRKAAARRLRDERRKPWNFWDGLAQWGVPTLGSEVFIFVTAFLLLGAGGVVRGGIGVIAGLLLWLTLLVTIAAKGGPQEAWRQVRRMVARRRP